MASDEPSYLVRLHTFLITYLDQEELRDLCFYLKINYQDLGGEGRIGHARELVLYCERHGKLPMLIRRCCELRPHACAELSTPAATSAATGSHNTVPDMDQRIDNASVLPGKPVASPGWPWFQQHSRLIVFLIVVIIVLFIWRMPLVQHVSEVPPAIPATAQAKTPELANNLQTFSGVWQVSEQSTNGSTLEHWNIVFNNEKLSVEAFHEAVPGAPLPSDYHEQLMVSDMLFDDQTLYFTAKRAIGVTTIYTLTMQTADRIEGSFTSTDTTLSDSGMIQGDAGIIYDAGRVIMVRKRNM